MVVLRVIVLVLLYKYTEAVFHTHFKVATLIQPPYVVADDESEGNFKGLLIDMMSALATKFNFTYEYYLVPDKKYGMKNTDGTWAGIIGEVAKGTAKIGLAPMTINAPRLEVVHFSLPFLTTGLSAVGKAITFPVVQENLPKILKMAEEDKITVGVQAQGSSHNFFSTTDIEIYKKLYQQMTRCPDCLVTNYQEGLQKVRSSPDNKPFVFFGEKDIFDYHARKSPCDLKVLTCDTLNTVHYGLVLPKAWMRQPPTELDIVNEINIALSKMLTSGIMQELKNKWFIKECPSTN